MEVVPVPARYTTVMHRHRPGLVRPVATGVPQLDMEGYIDPSTLPPVRLELSLTEGNWLVAYCVLCDIRFENRGWGEIGRDHPRVVKSLRRVWRGA